ncbi:MAG: acyl-CoA dehydrogenase family protein [Chloroflexota bacterium]|nr:acyl-CoA dehydrogenase family protein [Chloroflexota bacterium]
MDLTLPKEYELLRQMIREVMENEFAPVAEEADEKAEVPFEALEIAARAGLLGIPFPQEYGGSGAGELGYVILMEEISRVDSAISTIIGAHIGIAAMSIYVDGSGELKDRYLTPMSLGEKYGAFCLTEADAGSDAAAIKTRAIRANGNWVLNGVKTYISNAPFADIFSVLAVTDPALGARGGVTAFVAEKEMGVKIGTVEKKIGIRASSTSEVIFDEVEVPAANIIGQEGLGFVTFMKTLDLGRVTVGAASLGGAQKALEMVIEYARIAEKFGTSLAHQQQVQFMIADMYSWIDMLRGQVYRTAWLVDNGRPFSRESYVCKLMGSEIASKAASYAMEICGNLGLSRDYFLERAFRDARIAEIFEGTNEIQRVIIARDLLREVGVFVEP